MSVMKLGTSVFSAAVLSACAPGPYYADNNYEDEQRVVCRKEMPTGSHLKVMRCHVITDGMSVAQRDGIFRQYDTTIQGVARTGNGGSSRRSAEGSCGGNAEGSCGGNRGD